MIGPARLQGLNNARGFQSSLKSAQLHGISKSVQGLASQGKCVGNLAHYPTGPVGTAVNVNNGVTG